MRIEPKLIAETTRWWVIDKPAGWLSVPGRGGAPVLSEWVRRELGAAWVVHRLDRDTTGVILFARSADAHREASGWFERHEVIKHYDCLASGTLAMPVLRVSRAVDGAPAVTQFEVKERRREGAWLRARPLSGRRHQIRAHLASEGCPLWGDHEYGGPAEIEWADGVRTEVPRVALHAASLELPGALPDRERYESPWPQDLLSWLDALQKKGLPL